MTPTPTAIRYDRAARQLRLDFDNGAHVAIPAELLRVESPSAEVQGHHPGQKKTVAGKRDIGIVAIEPVGRYAIRLAFTDGHNTGIYTWAWLHRMGREQDAAWSAYLEALASAGLGRDG